MKFSVLIPVYNAKEYLSDAIESVLAQDDEDFEIVLIDDGSTDGSQEIYHLYTERYPDRIKAFKQENQGQLAARCNAILHSTGDYCLFLDADDLLAENAFIMLQQAIIEHEMPDMVVFPFYYDRAGHLEESKKISNVTTLYKDNTLREIYESFFRTTLLNSVWSKAVRREIAVESTLGYEGYTSLRCAEDRYQSMMMLRKVKSVLYLAKPLYRYRLVEGSTTRTFSAAAIDRFNTSILYDVEKELLDEWGLRTEEWRYNLDASSIGYPLYVLDLFYYRTKSADRRKVLAYNWQSFLPDEITPECIQTNPLVTKLNKSMWEWIFNNRYNRLRLYFYWKLIYKKIRAVKRRIIG